MAASLSKSVKKTSSWGIIHSFIPKVYHKGIFQEGKNTPV